MSYLRITFIVNGDVIVHYLQEENVDQTSENLVNQYNHQVDHRNSRFRHLLVFVISFETDKIFDAKSIGDTCIVGMMLEL